MATIPSLALIPSGYKGGSPGTLYSVLPTDGTGDFDFTRSGNATRVNSEGLIELVTTNVPRLNYPLIDGVVQGCPSLLLEPSRLNVATYSEDFSNGVYTQTNGTVTTNTAISPDGTQNADTWTATSGSAQLQGVVVITSGVQYTMSIYLKRKTGTGQVALRGVSNTSTNITITDEWQRYSVTLTSTDTNGRYGVILLNSGDEVYVWGAQLEAGSYATSYIPNYGTALGVTRSAETCNNAGDASTFNDSEGVLFAEISALANDSFRFISLSDGSNNNNVRFNLSTTANQISFEVNSAASLKFTYTNNNTNFLLNNKVAIKYKQNDFNVFINGIKLNSSTGLNGGNFPIGLNTLNFDRGTGGNVFYGNTKQIQYFNTALNDSDLETLTSWTSFSEMATSQLYTIE
jgi:hypothetical protein